MKTEEGFPVELLDPGYQATGARHDDYQNFLRFKFDAVVGGAVEFKPLVGRLGIFDPNLVQHYLTDGEIKSGEKPKIEILDMTDE